MTDFQVAIKVDVDTYLGARDGLPRLAAILAEAGVRASVFFSFGPDRAGRAVIRILTQPGFFRKMRRTRAVSTYGLRTVLSGTLLPGPHIGRRCGHLLPALREAGHDLGVHAWDHFAWVGRGPRLDEPFVMKQWGRAAEMYGRWLGSNPRSFAAPGWIINAAGMNVLAGLGLNYISVSRGVGPYFPAVDQTVYRVLEIPTTLPAADELLGPNVGPEDLPGVWSELFVENGLNVLTVHAEMEGRSLAGPFARLLGDLKGRGARFVGLDEVAAEVLRHPPEIPVCGLDWGQVPGRSSWTSIQGLPRGQDGETA